MNMTHVAINRSNALNPVLLATAIPVAGLGIALLLPPDPLVRPLLALLAGLAMLLNSVSLLYLVIRHPQLLCDESVERSLPPELVRTLSETNEWKPLRDP